MDPLVNSSLWTRFWHRPVRAERLAVVRILLVFALLCDQLLGYLPRLGELFGPEGVAFAGLHDEWLLDEWHLTALFFNTDNLQIVGAVFGLWVACTVLFLVGWQTRVMSVAVWFLTMTFINRNPIIKNGGDDVLCAGLFLLMFMPTGRAFSLDRWLGRRRYEMRGLVPPDGDAPMISPWSVRVLQIQLAVLYMTTGLAKLRGHVSITFDPEFSVKIAGTWWEGTSVYYVLNDVTMARVAWPELPMPWWATYAMTWSSLFFEVFFPFLVLSRWTRRWTLWFGVLFHIGIYLLIEVGWFSFYTLSLYGAWIPGEFWDRWLHSKHNAASPTACAPI